jgi:hypothetical protein
MKRITGIILIIFFFFRTFAQLPISFIEEYIDFSIDNNYFVVNGIYVFTNNTSDQINQNIIFPFASESRVIDSMRLYNLKTQQQISFQKQNKSIAFGIQILPHDTLEINIFYRQPVSKKNVYILKSTQTWKKPLIKAVYSLTAKKDIKIDSFSFEPDTMKTENDKKIYYWEKHNFMPEKDFEVIIK